MFQSFDDKKNPGLSDKYRKLGCTTSSLDHIIRCELLITNRTIHRLCYVKNSKMNVKSTFTATATTINPNIALNNGRFEMVSIPFICYRLGILFSLSVCVSTYPNMSHNGLMCPCATDIHIVFQFSHFTMRISCTTNTNTMAGRSIDISPPDDDRKKMRYIGEKLCAYTKRKWVSERT